MTINQNYKKMYFFFNFRKQKKTESGINLTRLVNRAGSFQPRFSVCENEIERERETSEILKLKELLVQQWRLQQNHRKRTQFHHYHHHHHHHQAKATATATTTTTVLKPQTKRRCFGWSTQFIKLSFTRKPQKKPSIPLSKSPDLVSPKSDPLPPLISTKLS